MEKLIFSASPLSRIAEIWLKGKACVMLVTTAISLCYVSQESFEQDEEEYEVLL